MITMWAAKWRSRGCEGDRWHLCWRTDSGAPALFRTRKQCRAWIETAYGYIRKRKDLRKPPHRWSVPVPCRVAIEEIERKEARG